MKRVIRYHYKHGDEVQFSDCSTEYEVLPILVEDSAGIEELRAIARQLQIKTAGAAADLETPQYGFRAHTVTHALKIAKKLEQKNFWGRKEKSRQEYLGFITLEKCDEIKPVAKPGKKLTKDQMREIFNDMSHGVDNIVDIDGTCTLVMSGWDYTCALKLKGYDVKHFEKSMGIEERAFSDSVSSCEECGEYNYTDDGYRYNFRMHPKGGYLGTECGCYDEYSKKNYLDFVGDTEHAMERDTAKELEDEGKIELVETFIGGMTDGRGGYFDGKSTREGHPDQVLEEYQKKEPKAKLLFVHEESGQFQTYFSLYRVKAGKGKLKAVPNAG